MHTHHLNITHTLSHGLHFVEHHLFMTAVVMLVVFGIVALVNAPVNEMPTQFLEQSVAPAVSTNYLTLLNDPQYAQEYTTRTQYIHTHLATLQETLKAERVYAFSYTRREPRTDETEIARVFESVLDGRLPKFERLEGLSYSAWQHIMDTENVPSSMYPLLYGVSLYNVKGEEIGYFGVELQQALMYLQEQQIQLLHQTVADVEAALTAPLAALRE